MAPPNMPGCDGGRSWVVFVGKSAVKAERRSRIATGGGAPGGRVERPLKKLSQSMDTGRHARLSENR